MIVSSECRMDGHSQTAKGGVRGPLPLSIMLGLFVGPFHELTVAADPSLRGQMDSFLQVWGCPHSALGSKALSLGAC
jgi:hypothetical protein